MSDKIAIKNQDLVLRVSHDVNPSVWNEDKYYQFVNRLCGSREYQKEAIWTALRYLLGEQYENLAGLAHENWQNGNNEALAGKFKTFELFRDKLSFPDKLAGSLDLATGTGKSYVLYSIAAIMLAEGKVDRVLVLCPSTTIEDGLLEKFRELASDTELVSLLGANAPKVINGSESVVVGSICIENYHQILENATSSIRDSLAGKGARTLVLNDEAHHVYSNENGDPEKPETLRKWKAFLDSPEFGFRYIIGVSGTCYIKDSYFPDVLYRYSLRQAIENGYVKSVQYVAKADDLRDKSQKWQLVVNKHNERVDEIKGLGILPITIVVTQKTRSCDAIAAEFKEFLKKSQGLSDEQVSEKVLVAHSKSKENYRLKGIDNSESKIEWVFSVSMLAEGWDVKRVFQIVPHEERAFNSKLLIAQVMGRGLRIPVGWHMSAGQPKVVVFNHESWAGAVQGLVNDVLEYEKKIVCRNMPESEYNFELLNVEYDPRAKTKTVTKKPVDNLFKKGFVALATAQEQEEKYVEFDELISGGVSTKWKTTLQNKTYSIDEMTQTMFDRLGEADEAETYQKEYPIEKLKAIIERSLEESGSNVITDESRQNLLRALNTIRQKTVEIPEARFEIIPTNFIEIKTSDYPRYDSASASSLHKDKYLFITGETVNHVSSEEKEFYGELSDRFNNFNVISIANKYEFKTPLNLVIADSKPEARFIDMLTNKDTAPHIDKWIKSAHVGFYSINYSWRSESHHSKISNFNPDFFIVVGNRIIIAEVKGDEKLRGDDEHDYLENKGKNVWAKKHFEIINEELEKRGSDLRYKFTFITPKSFGALAEAIKSQSVDKIDKFTSELDIVL